MTPQEFAALLHGCEYGDEILDTEEDEAKRLGFVVAFGASDDLLELRGAIHDETGAWDGTERRVTTAGVLPAWDSIDHDDEAEAEAYFLKKHMPFKTLKAEWAPASMPNTSWLLSIDCPHATFDVMEDGEVFCRGIVFRLADVSAERGEAR